MLNITREEVLAFVEAEHLSYRTDSSNAEDAFFRNRLRHQLIPLLKEENPGIVSQMSRMAQRLRQDEAYLCEKARQAYTLNPQELAQMPEALQSRVLERFLKEAGIPEPEAAHIALAKSLALSANPSASATFPGGVRIGRCYDRLMVLEELLPIETAEVHCPGETVLPTLGLKILCVPAARGIVPQGTLWVRSRRSGDEITLPGGTKSLKKLLIDRKIPASQRMCIPVIADDRGVMAVQGFGMNLKYLQEDGYEIRFEPIT
jgi:tRNA(Ile)-lysidine synthase